MGFLVVGVAVGVVLTVLLRAWTRYEAASSAALRDQVVELESALETLAVRVESLEAIATSDAGLSTILPDDPATPVDSGRFAKSRAQETGR